MKEMIKQTFLVQKEVENESLGPDVTQHKISKSLSKNVIKLPNSNTTSQKSRIFRKHTKTD